MRWDITLVSTAEGSSSPVYSDHLTSDETLDIKPRSLSFGGSSLTRKTKIGTCALDARWNSLSTTSVMSSQMTRTNRSHSSITGRYEFLRLALGGSFSKTQTYAHPVASIFCLIKTLNGLVLSLITPLRKMRKRLPIPNIVYYK